MRKSDRDELNAIEEAFLPVAIAFGILKADDERPEDYKGSVEHQRDLTKRLGLNPDDFNPDDKEVAMRFYNRFLQAQIDGKDDNGEPLFVRDMWLLGYFTGRSA